MKIAVIGASGLIGSILSRVLDDHGIDTIRASSSSGVDVYRGHGLDEVLAGADVVVDVTNVGSFGETDALDFFKTAGSNLLEAARSANLAHYLVLSVVGAERLVENDYFRAKLVQENLLRASGLPFTVVRSTQFFECFGGIVDQSGSKEVIRLPSIRIQPLSADEAAASIARVALGEPRNSVVEISGPESLKIAELAKELATATEDPRPVEEDISARYFGVRVSKDGLLPGNQAVLASLTFHDWLVKATAA